MADLLDKIKEILNKIGAFIRGLIEKITGREPKETKTKTEAEE